MNSDDLIHTIAHKADFSSIQSELDALLQYISSQSLELLDKYKHDNINSYYNKSAINLIHYLALRRIDLRQLQDKLADSGLSSLGRCEAHVIDSICKLLNILSTITGNKNTFDLTFQTSSLYPSYSEGRGLLVQHTDLLFGHKQDAYRSRIMVTLPTEAVEDPSFIQQLIKNGMDSARINCAHDDRQTWLKMIKTIQSTILETRQACKIVMDLAGPKLRTGVMPTQDSILHIKVKKNRYGERLSPTRLLLIPDIQHDTKKNTTTLPYTYQLPVNREILALLRAGDRLRFTDTRGKLRFIDIVEQLNDGQWLAECAKGTFISADTVFFLLQCDS